MSTPTSANELDGQLALLGPGARMALLTLLYAYDTDPAGLGFCRIARSARREDRTVHAAALPVLHELDWLIDDRDHRDNRIVRLNNAGIAAAEAAAERWRQARARREVR